jgi:acetyltransferase
VLAAASVENPVDILAGAGPATYALCLDALLSDETVDAVVVIQAPQDWFKPASLAEVVGEVASMSGMRSNASAGAISRAKPVLGVIMGLATTGEATQILHNRHIPNYQFPERVGSTLGAMWQREQWLNEVAAELVASRLASVDVAAARLAIQTALDANRSGVVEAGSLPQRVGWMSPVHTEALLRAYGVSLPCSRLARNVPEALCVAEKIGYPVALKLAARGVTHKTEVGGVALNIAGADQLRVEFEAMTQRAQELDTGMEIEGVYVQQMVKGGVELIAGVVRDPQFGPLVMVGTGGTEVEMRRDVAFELAPLSAGRAKELLDRTSAGRLLAGFRGAPARDSAAAIDAILRLAQMAMDCPEIQEIEVNPLIVMKQGQGAAAVDTRVRIEQC